VTAQSPSVQLAALKIRVKNMSNSLDSAGIEAIMMMTSGTAYGAALGGGAEDDDDDLSPAIMSELENDDPMLAASIEDEEKMAVDGVSMDGAVAADIEGNGTAALTDAEVAALSPATGNPEPFSQDAMQEAQDYAGSASKIEHVIDPAKHNFGDLVEAAGGRSEAMQQIVASLGDGVGLPESGPFEVTRTIQGEVVTIRGAVVNGIPKIGTAYIP
jgi:hypothetical protein